ncbi:hypothetical protein LR48_Vigan08g058600 [Vigna angularis]|uniref:Uncharacterized protein n=1 Tax=Phaseolus angularis TaxID=3914 RepID=A0A0L9V4X4_PHAAN|nr:hypothetical protein LR48_Vigan08g058600 [Vigna angularis]
MIMVNKTFIVVGESMLYSAILKFKIGYSSAYLRNGTPLYALLRSDLVHSGFHEVESRGRGTGGGLPVKNNPTDGGKVDGGSVGLVALGDGGSHDVVATRGTGGGGGGGGGEKRVAEGSVGEGIEGTRAYVGWSASNLTSCGSLASNLTSTITL